MNQKNKRNLKKFKLPEIPNFNQMKNFMNSAISSAATSAVKNIHNMNSAISSVATSGASAISSGSKNFHKISKGSNLDDDKLPDCPNPFSYKTLQDIVMKIDDQKIDGKEYTVVSFKTNDSPTGIDNMC